jgi:hypothetical protein
MAKKNIKDGDYILKDGSGWFETAGVVIWIHTSESGSVGVTAYRSGSELDDSLAGFVVCNDD